MALRNQPYLPLYIQDFLTDEKLNECSASSTGVYIRLMCMLHKSETYGKILLKQKYKQTCNQIKNFAHQVAKHFPYELAVVEAGLVELIEENVLQIDGDFLMQKRMVKDNDISEKRASAGHIGGKKTTQKNSNNFAQSNIQSKSENEIENTIETDSDKKDSKKFVKPTVEQVAEYLSEKQFPGTIQIEAEKFCDFYESKGWKVGKTGMKDWKAAIRNWIKNSNQNTNGQSNHHNQSIKPAHNHREQRADDVANLKQRAIDIQNALKGSTEQNPEPVVFE